MKANIKDEKVLKAFGEHLKKLRESRKISQAKLALEINSYQSTIIRIEKARMNPSLCMLVAISKVLDISLQELMDFKIPEK